MLLAGGVCVYFGTRWNRHGNEHTFYFIPVQAWGWTFLAVVGLFAVGAIAGAVWQGLEKPSRLYLGIAGVVALAATTAVGIYSRRLARPAGTDNGGASAEVGGE